MKITYDCDNITEILTVLQKEGTGVSPSSVMEADDPTAVKLGFIFENNNITHYIRIALVAARNEPNKELRNAFGTSEGRRMIIRFALDTVNRWAEEQKNDSKILIEKIISRWDEI